MRQRSFTLIELLVVIAVIGLLASIIIVNLTGARTKANIARGLQFSQSIHHALGSEAVGVWSFDEGSGTTANDASGYGNNGTLVNGPVWRCDDTPSNTGCSIQFDGSNDYVICGTDTILRGDVMTVEAWVKVSDQDYNPLLTWGSTVPALYVHFPHLLNKALILIGPSNYRYFNHNIDPDDGNWHHIVFIITGNGQYDINNSEMYVDTQPLTVNTTLNSGLPTAKTLCYIGRASSYYFNGLIDEVRIYEKALEAARIEELYYAGLDNLLAKGLIDKQEYQKRLALK